MKIDLKKSYDSVEIYELFKPGKATPTIDGQFYSFVLAVFEQSNSQQN